MSDTLKTTGAPSVLAFAAEREHIARKDLALAEEVLKKCLKLQMLNPPELEGQDFDRDVRIATEQRDNAIERWNEYAGQVYKFDKSVDVSKRDASEKLSKDQVATILSAAHIYERTNIEGLISTVCDAVLSCRTQIEVHELIASKIRECSQNAFTSAAREGHLPDWAMEALLGK